MRTNRDDILVHPNTIIRLFDKGVERLGSQAMLKGRTYSITREAWIGSVFLLGLRLLTNTTWWLRINKDEASAEDMFAHSYEEIDKNRTRQNVLAIQVFTHRKSDKGGVLDGIKRKLMNVDLKGCSLVCYLMKDELIIWSELNKRLTTLYPTVSEIWIIGNIRRGLRTYGVFKAYPDVRETFIDLNNNYQRPEEKSFLHPYRGFRKGNLFERLGKVIELKPDFTFEDI